MECMKQYVGCDVLDDGESNESGWVKGKLI